MDTLTKTNAVLRAIDDGGWIDVRDPITGRLDAQVEFKDGAIRAYDHLGEFIEVQNYTDFRTFGQLMLWLETIGRL